MRRKVGGVIALMLVASTAYAQDAIVSATMCQEIDTSGGEIDFVGDGHILDMTASFATVVCPIERKDYSEPVIDKLYVYTRDTHTTTGITCEAIRQNPYSSSYISNTRSSTDAFTGNITLAFNSFSGSHYGNTTLWSFWCQGFNGDEIIGYRVVE